MSATAAVARPPERAADLGLIADRYRVERVLGRGGMGEVLAVVEPETGQRFALKRLLPGAKARHATLLSREYHTLASLRHPNVVQAFDFGISDGVPYYTMELLAGSDVEAVCPLPWTDVVPIMRDVASALSLIHARHLVHRDVGARNVWRTPEGVVKLIDFGAMTNFGASSNLAGTPPYIAPEALRTHVLDQRTDLYALGALGYYLLTGRQAYPARTFADLERFWAEPLIPPTARLADLQPNDLPALPESLEQLIEVLLSHAPEARPSSAAEVLDRLDAVLPGESAVSDVALRGMLASKAFVGRERERKRLERLLQRTLEGTGASIVLIGPRGIGRSRLMAELGFDARLAGASAILMAGDGESTALSAASRALLKLLEALPSATRAASQPHARVLGHLSEAVRSALDVEREALEQFPELQGEARIRLQSALRSVWLEVTRDKPVALLLDDVHAMDPASIAFFASLSREAGQRKLLVVASARSDDDAPPAIAQPLADKSPILKLGSLAREESHEMLRSIFGDADNLGRTASHLAREAEGNPGRLMETCEYLVHHDKIRFVEGAWMLPLETTELAAPASLVQLDEARLARLSSVARELAGALSVVSGAVALELCAALSPLPEDRLFPALDELCAAGVLMQGELGYRFRSDVLRASLRDALPSEVAQKAHVAAGEALLNAGDPDAIQRLRAGVHLMHGGQLRRGVEIVHHAAIEALERIPTDYSGFAHELAPAYELAQQLGLSDHEKLSFLSLLSAAGYFADRRFGQRYGQEALSCGERVCGMNLARRLAPWFGRKLGLYVALIIAAVRAKRLAKKSRLVPDLPTAIRLFMTSAACLSGMHTVCMDGEKVRSVARAMQPLVGLGSEHVASVVYRFVEGCALALQDRIGGARAHWEPLLARLKDPRPIAGLNEANRLYYIAACTYVLGSGEVWRDDSRTLQLADELEAQPIKLYHISADQIRAVYYAQQGNMHEAARHRARVELHALERGTTWQVEIWQPSSTISTAGRQRDAMAFKRAGQQLRQFADAPVLRGYIDIARAMYLNLRGRYDEAIELFERLLAQRSSDVIGYTNLVASLAQAYSASGRFSDAERITREVLRKRTAEELALPGLMLRAQIEHALALSGLGKNQEAALELDALIARYAPHEGPLTLGALHDARANVALRAQDEETALRHVREMEHWYRSTDCPALIQHCDRVTRRLEKNRVSRLHPSFLPSMSFLATRSENLQSTLQQDTPEDLLRDFVKAAGAREGVLYWEEEESGPQLLKSRHDELPEGLHSWVEERMRAPLDYSTESEEDGELSDPNALQLDGNDWRVFVLVNEHGLESSVVGVLALASPTALVPQDALRALAHQLQATGARSVSRSQWT